jgi:hypothetical protein
LDLSLKRRQIRSAFWRVSAASTAKHEKLIVNNFKDQTANLLLDIANSAHARKALVQQIRLGAVDMLHGFGRARAAQANALRVELSDDRASRIEQVLSLRDQACSVTAQYRSEHALMGCQLRQRLIQSSDAVMGAVDSLRIGFAERRIECLRNHRVQSRALRKSLTQHRSDGVRAVVELMRGFGASHRKMAGDQRAEFASAGQSRTREMSELRQHFYATRTKSAVAPQQSISTPFDNIHPAFFRSRVESLPVAPSVAPDEALVAAAEQPSEALPERSAGAERPSLAERVAAILAKRPANWTPGAKPANMP